MKTEYTKPLESLGQHIMQGQLPEAWGIVAQTPAIGAIVVMAALWACWRLADWFSMK